VAGCAKMIDEALGNAGERSVRRFRFPFTQEQDLHPPLTRPRAWFASSSLTLEYVVQEEVEGRARMLEANIAHTRRRRDTRSGRRETVHHSERRFPRKGKHV
jgi:hypothetical protein